MHRYINLFIIIFFCICLKERLNPLAAKESNSKPTDNPEQVNKSSAILSVPSKIKETESRIPAKTKDKNWKSFENIPSEFDAREQWKMCTIIGEGIYEGLWENSWAVATSSALADRICIAQGGQFNEHLSVKELLFCCKDCGPLDESSTAKAWEYYRDFGGLSGPHFNNFGVCPPEKSKIDDTNFRRKTTNVYTLKGINEIKQDIFTYGPVSAVLRIYEDSENYKTDDLYVYNRIHSTKSYKLQAVKIIGWGKGEDNAFPHWLCVKTHGNSWEASGTFKINLGLFDPNTGGDIIAGEPFVKKKSFVQRWLCG
ncbi:Hypothetical protein CINCED_3A017790 [Cinara cedri]|uniref:Peptidase C1A papain C-terminal domain-containing protein n=1 Tax=Cinara cedri TaxID=506608 RepID=A0A5E4MBY6_9HEMI|nr:Hypothetical protein CINCED_3A017790 [Cinara cedri]